MKTSVKFFVIMVLFVLSFSTISCSNTQVLEEEEMEQIIQTTDKMSWGGDDED